MSESLTSLAKRVAYLEKFVATLPQPKPLRFIDNGDGTVTDKETNLVWQKDCVEEMPWKDAMDYAKENKAKSPRKGWRLPTVKELQSLVDYENGPAELEKSFSGIYRDYWSATTRSDPTTLAWYMTLSSGLTASTGKTNANNVRCVRPASI